MTSHFYSDMAAAAAAAPPAQTGSIGITPKSTSDLRVINIIVNATVLDTSSGHPIDARTADARLLDVYEYVYTDVSASSHGTLHPRDFLHRIDPFVRHPLTRDVTADVTVWTHHTGDIDVLENVGRIVAMSGVPSWTRHTDTIDGTIGNVFKYTPPGHTLHLMVQWLNTGTIVITGDDWDVNKAVADMQREWKDAKLDWTISNARVKNVVCIADDPRLAPDVKCVVDTEALAKMFPEHFEVMSKPIWGDGVSFKIKSPRIVCTIFRNGAVRFAGNSSVSAYEECWKKLKPVVNQCKTIV